MVGTEAQARQALQRLLDDFNRQNFEDRAQITEASGARLWRSFAG